MSGSVHQTVINIIIGSGNNAGTFSGPSIDAQKIHHLVPLAGGDRPSDYGFGIGVRMMFLI
jgi:hypothetical protein